MEFCWGLIIGSVYSVGAVGVPAFFFIEMGATHKARACISKESHPNQPNGLGAFLLAAPFRSSTYLDHILRRWLAQCGHAS